MKPLSGEHIAYWGWKKERDNKEGEELQETEMIMLQNNKMIKRETIIVLSYVHDNHSSISSLSLFL